MRKTLTLLKKGFESSCGLTPEFSSFFRTFKSEFTKELKGIGATNIEFHRGHFYISGFFDVNNKSYYFSISDVRDSYQTPDLLYRTAKDHKDYTGGKNCYVKIESGMASKMEL